MATEGPSKKTIIIWLGASVLGILLAIGIWCLCLVEMTHTVTHVEEYMNKCVDSRYDLPCANFTPQSKWTYCQCSHNFRLKQDLVGTVTLYYELVDFHQTNSTYAKSRDDNQLRGNLEQWPAKSCGNYSFDGDKPIFPCGEVADSMFNDTFTNLKRKDVNPAQPVHVVYTNLFTSDKPAFKNPPADSIKLKNYTRPIHWMHPDDPEEENPWEYETDLKGVENPAFQAWMDTTLKRKPVWRVDQKGNFSNGLPAGNYSLKIRIYYGVDRYAGVRKLIFEGANKSYGPQSLAWGVILLLLSLGGILLAVSYFIYTKVQNKSPTANNAATPPSDDKEVPLLNRLRDRIRNMRS